MSQHLSTAITSISTRVMNLSNLLSETARRLPGKSALSGEIDTGRGRRWKRVLLPSPPH